MHSCALPTAQAPNKATSCSFATSRASVQSFHSKTCTVHGSSKSRGCCPGQYLPHLPTVNDQQAGCTCRMWREQQSPCPVCPKVRYGLPAQYRTRGQQRVKHARWRKLLPTPSENLRPSDRDISLWPLICRPIILLMCGGKDPTKKRQILSRCANCRTLPVKQVGRCTTAGGRTGIGERSGSVAGGCVWD